MMYYKHMTNISLIYVVDRSNLWAKRPILCLKQMHVLDKWLSDFLLWAIEFKK